MFVLKHVIIKEIQTLSCRDQVRISSTFWKMCSNLFTSDCTPAIGKLMGLYEMLFSQFLRSKTSCAAFHTVIITLVWDPLRAQSKTMTKFTVWCRASTALPNPWPLPQGDRLCWSPPVADLKQAVTQGKGADHCSSKPPLGRHLVVCS